VVIFEGSEKGYFSEDFELVQIAVWSKVLVETTGTHLQASHSISLIMIINSSGSVGMGKYLSKDMEHTKDEMFKSAIWSCK